MSHHEEPGTWQAFNPKEPINKSLSSNNGGIGGGLTIDEIVDADLAD
jgi:hypothetical protein